MKTLILSALFIFSFSAFAFQNSDVDCAALAESTERVGKNVKTSETKEVKEDSSAVIGK